MQKNKSRRSGLFNRKKFLRKLALSAFPIFIGSLLATLIITSYTFAVLESRAHRNFVFIGNEIRHELIDRLETHALMLRAGIAYFSLAWPVSRNDWKDYVSLSRIERYLPGVQGIGYAAVIPPDQLTQHVEEIKKEGFPDYQVFPSYPRDVYTSIVFVEPFTGRNRRAFGYDMFTEPVRRTAMELSCDYDIAYLSGRIRLTLDTGDEEMYASIMYVPYYEPNTPTTTVEQRRMALRGWLYSPYRLNTLMQDIQLYNPQENPVRVQLFDGFIADSTLMYDSKKIGHKRPSGFWNRNLNLEVNFNRNQWILSFTQPREFPFRSLMVFLFGIVINLLLYYLLKVSSKVELRSKQIKSQNKRLKTLNATKDKFFTIIAHDLKSPYNAVLGFSEILITQVENMDRKDIVNIAQMIRKSTNLAVDLLMNLMVWSQSQTGKIKYRPEEINVTELFTHIKLLYNDLAAQKEIRLVFEVPEQAKVFGDREMLDTILRNLVSNAIKFTMPGGLITISAVKDRKAMLFAVSDNGIGIPEENFRKLFRIDESYSTSGTNKEKGTGLGLILCREFVEKHGGRIWVESTIGKGSVFRFTIPLKK